MRKLICALWIAATVGAFAAPSNVKIDVVLVGLTAGTTTVSTVSGYIEEVAALCTDGVSTGTVEVAILPVDSLAAINIATNSVVASKLWRPRVDSTDTTGAANTSDPPQRYFLYGEKVRVIVADSPTNKTWSVRIKTNDK